MIAIYMAVIAKYIGIKKFCLTATHLREQFRHDPLYMDFCCV